MIGKIKEVSLCFSCYKSDKFYDSWRGKKISGGGVMLSQALHRIDRLIYFFGDPEFVEGFMRTTRPGIEVEDYAECRLYFGDDVIAEIKADNSSGNPDTISMIKIVGDKGLIVLCDDRVLQWDVGCMPCPQASDFSRIPVKIRPLYYGPCHELIIDDFVDAVLNDRLPIVGPHDAEITMRTIFGFYQAAREQKRVFLK